VSGFVHSPPARQVCRGCAELDEPAAMKALIELKPSANTRFQDRPGACKLIETAVSRGDQSMAQRLASAAPTERVPV
jgi:hypothetical protein